MSERRCFYEVLNCSREVSSEELRRAYKKEALKHHPDRNAGNPEAEARFKEINEAYGVLSDDQKREIYDQYGHAGFEGGGPGGMGDVVSHMQDLFNEMFSGGFGFGGGRRAPNGAARGGDLQIQAQLSLREAAFGCKREVSLKSPVACGDCSGSGAAAGSKPEKCGMCKGSGQVATARGFVMFSSTCPSCRGQGVLIKNPCGGCKGRGAVDKQRTVQVSFPAGVDRGQRLRVSGQGLPGVRGGPNGDLYVDIDVEDHDVFERDGADLAVNVKISYALAALGGTVPVPVLAPDRDDATTQIEIPAGTQPGSVIPMRGQGLPRLDGRGRGTLAVVVQVEVPQSLNERAKNLLVELERELSGASADRSGPTEAAAPADSSERAAG